MILNIISLILIFVLVLIIFYSKKINTDVRSSVYLHFLNAENIFTDKILEYKMDYVFENVYPYLPTYLKIFITKDRMWKLLQKFYEEINMFLNNIEVGVEYV